MEGIRVYPYAFASDPDTHTTLLYGERLEDSLPVVVKQRHFTHLQDPDTQRAITRYLNAALLQAKVQHPNICDVLELGLQMDQSHCIISHVLEALDTDLAKAVQERTETEHLFRETEVINIALQTAAALSFAHSKGVAHQDIKPKNIFRRGPTYKLGDFG